MRHLFPFSWSSNTHLHFLSIKIHMNKTIVCLGCADKIRVSGTCFRRIRECFLGQLHLWRGTVAPVGGKMVPMLVHEHRTPRNPVILKICTFIIDNSLVGEGKLAILIERPLAPVVCALNPQSIGVEVEPRPVLGNSRGRDLV